MEYRRLGKSGLKVSALSLGSWLTFGKQIDDSVARDMMVTAYEAGVNFFDNAEAYALGKSEEVMGKLLSELGWDRSTYLVSSKVFFGRSRDWPTQMGLNKKHIFEACHEVLKRLQVDYLDLYFCHRPDKETPIEETVWAMHQLIMAGKVLYWGTSEWSAQEIMEAHAVANRYNLIAPVMEQPQYNMLHRDKVEVEYSQIYKTVGLGTTIWSPLASGVLSGKYLDAEPGKDTRFSIEGLEWLHERYAHIDEKVLINLKTLADELGCNMNQLAIAWCLKNSNVSTVILGASKIWQLEDNLKSLGVVEKLNDEVMVKIEEILGNAPKRPAF